LIRQVNSDLFGLEVIRAGYQRTSLIKTDVPADLFQLLRNILTCFVPTAGTTTNKVGLETVHAHGSFLLRSESRKTLLRGVGIRYERAATI
jgi:hypothetical protein